MFRYWKQSSLAVPWVVWVYWATIFICAGDVTAMRVPLNVFIVALFAYSNEIEWVKEQGLVAFVVSLVVYGWTVVLPVSTD
ncbi:MAG: hypothetical protein AAF198_06285 [Pseudomonadota bacterium]